MKWGSSKGRITRLGILEWAAHARTLFWVGSAAYLATNRVLALALSAQSVILGSWLLNAREVANCGIIFTLGRNLSEFKAARQREPLHLPHYTFAARPIFPPQPREHFVTSFSGLFKARTRWLRRSSCSASSGAAIFDCLQRVACIVRLCRFARRWFGRARGTGCAGSGGSVLRSSRHCRQSFRSADIWRSRRGSRCTRQDLRSGSPDSRNYSNDSCCWFLVSFSPPFAILFDKTDLFHSAANPRLRAY